MGQTKALQLQVLRQALEDILTYELGLPLVGEDDDPEELYEDALVYIAQFPQLVDRWRSLDKRQWLEELQDAS
jgi:hypothetical protein